MLAQWLGLFPILSPMLASLSPYWANLRGCFTLRGRFQRPFSLYWANNSIFGPHQILGPFNIRPRKVLRSLVKGLPTNFGPIIVKFLPTTVLGLSVDVGRILGVFKILNPCNINPLPYWSHTGWNDDKRRETLQTIFPPKKKKKKKEIRLNFHML